MESIAARVVARYQAANEVQPQTDDPKARFEALMVYNTTLAKLMQRLKRDAGAKTIAQNYKGTGSQAFRRQLWVNFVNGAVIDLWLDKGFISFGGVVARNPKGEHSNTLGRVPYGDRTPEQIYALTAKVLKEWSNQ